MSASPEDYQAATLVIEHLGETDAAALKRIIADAQQANAAPAAPPVDDGVDASFARWTAKDPNWVKQIPPDLWQHIALARAGFFDK